MKMPDSYRLRPQENELLMRQVRHTAAPGTRSRRPRRAPEAEQSAYDGAAVDPRHHAVRRRSQPHRRSDGSDLQQQAWRWALTRRGEDGALPSGKVIAGHFGRHERWGRLIKRAGLAGQFSDNHRQAVSPPPDEEQPPASAA